MAVLRAVAGVWRVSKLALPQLRDLSLSWKWFVGGLVHVYSPGRRRRKYAICIIYDIAFSSLLVEAAAMEAMRQRT